MFAPANSSRGAKVSAGSSSPLHMTTFPTGVTGHADRYRVERACALAFCEWQGKGLRTVQAVRIAFDWLHESVCRRHDPRGFLRWFDDTPREEMRRDLLAEVERELTRRAESPAPAGE